MDIGKKISMTQDEDAKLKTLAKEGVTSRPKIIDLTRSLKQEKQASAFWKSRYDELREQTKDYIAAVKHAPENERTTEKNDKAFKEETIMKIVSAAFDMDTACVNVPMDNGQSSAV